MKYVMYILILVMISIFIFGIDGVFAETETFKVASRSFEQIGIYLNQGDELEFEITVNGGSNDDIELTIFMPDDEKNGFVYGHFSDEFTATTSGTYTFSFSNTFSLISNKNVKFDYSRTQNTYYVYVRDLPNYAENYAGNVMYNATEFWKNTFPKKNFYVAETENDADIIISWVKDFTGMKHVGFQYVRLVEVGLGDSNCLDQWNPYSSKHITEIMTHEIGHSIGLGHSDDPNSIMYPTASSTSYGNISQKFNLGENQGSFIPFCVSQEPSSIQYSVESSDPTHGFDVYVIPSKEEYDNILQQESFEYYSDAGCFGENFLAYGGECNGVSLGSGLAVMQKSLLSHSTTSITVNYFETEYDGTKPSFNSKMFPWIHDTATIDVMIFDNKVDFSSDFYQNRDDSIRFEDGDGSIIHKYDNVSTVKNLFDSFGLSMTQNCLSFTDDISYCENDDHSLEFFVNEQKYNSLSNYVFNDGDKITINYDVKFVSDVMSQDKTSSESKQEIIESTTENTNEIVCVRGTIMKDGVCLPLSSDQSKTNGGGCLIATAAYGSELSPQVQFLREIRDNIVMNTVSGTSFMTGFNLFYYSFSPTIADWERENPIFQEIVRISITPMMSSLSILNNVDSEESMLGLGIGIISLNLGIYVGIPVFLSVILVRKFKPKLRNLC